MSYFDVPRLHFSGSFRAAPSTLNNVQSNFSGTPPLQPLWNPKGSHDFQILRGNEFTLPPGAPVTPCAVRSIVLASGEVITDPALDSLIGRALVSTNLPSNAKLVDLDVNQQQVSQIWGMQISIGDILTGDYEAAYFQQIFTSRAPGGFASGFSAAYQSLLVNLQWPEGEPDSPLLRAWRTSSPDVLSIRFTVDRLDANPTLANGSPNPNFTLGRISGTIGPGSDREPVHVTVGRMLRKVTVTEGPDLETAVFASMEAASKEDLGAAMLALPAAPPNRTVNYAPARVDAARNVVGFDLGNSLPFLANGSPANAGIVEAAIDAPSGPIVLGTIANTLANYEQRAFLFEFPLGDNAEAAASNPLVVLSNGAIVLSENPAGAWIDADEHVYRMDANGRADFTLYATRFGAPVDGVTVRLTSRIRGVPQQAQQPLSVSPASVTMTGGKATATMFGGIPGDRRGPVDGQIYAVNFLWDENTSPDPSAAISIHVYDAFTPPPTPQWSDVQPILGQFMFLYPFMQTILDLSDEATVKANAQLIAAFMRFPMTDTHFMPVTRDLSGPKTAMVLQYLDAQGGS